MEISLQTMKEMITAYAGKIDAPAQLLPAYSVGDESRPNIAMDADGGLFYQVYERGVASTNERAADADELCYFVFNDISFSMATKYELHNRNTRQDCRRILFAKQLELLGRMQESWQRRKQKEQEAILLKNPYDDNSMLRLDHLDKLRKTGMVYEAAMREANQKFPPPGQQ